MNDELYLQAREVCELLRISRAMLSKLTRENTRGFTDKVVRSVGKRRILFDKQNLIQWVEEGRIDL